MSHATVGKEGEKDCDETEMGRPCVHTLVAKQSYGNPPSFDPSAPEYFDNA